MSRDEPPGARFFGHPTGLAYLAFTEAWERFSFSGMQALLVLYMVAQLLTPGHVEHVVGFATTRTVLETVYGPLAPQPLSSAIFGLYTGLVFFAPVFGGYLGDRWFGQHAMVMAGAVLMALGHLLMALESAFLLALLLLILGAGCLKGNISKQVDGLYRDGDRRRTEGFQIFSMAINTGVIAAPLVCGTLGELYGWHYGFGAAGIGMMIGLGIYMAGKRHLPPDNLEIARTAGPVLPADRRVLGVLAVVFVVTCCFLVAAGQLGNAYTLWLLDHADRQIGGLTIPVTWFQALTPLFSVLLTPLVVRRWRTLADKGREPGLFAKMAIGLAMAGAGLLLLAPLSHLGHVPWWAVLPTHVLVCLAYVMVYPVGLALFSQVAPAGARAMYIGIFFITSFVASNLVGFLGGYYTTMPQSLFWSLHGALALAGALLALVAIPASRSVLDMRRPLPGAPADA
ncbi:peptide MFS transporter [Novosphingobium sp. BL-52-GroH]|uniref:peptide MFS transporter n=1 Tax=Novosphingobium sp. BL-52-GroH TaxID=3349877 RepID=UPI00384BE991